MGKSQMKVVEYYAQGDVQITDGSIRLGTKTFQADKAASFGTEASLFGTYRWYDVLPFFLPFILLFMGILLPLVLLFGGIFVWGIQPPVEETAGAPPAIAYADDWTDYLTTFFFVLAAIVALKVGRANPSIRLVVRDEKRNVLGTFATPDEAELRRVAEALVAAIGRAHAGVDTTEELRAESDRQVEQLIFADRLAYITRDLVWVMGRTYRLEDITSAWVKTVTLAEPFVLWPLFFVVFAGPRMFEQVFSVPMALPTDLRFPLAWVNAVGLLALLLAAVLVNIRIRRTGRIDVYALVLQGRFGYWDRKVVLSENALFSFDKAYVERVANAVWQAVNVRQPEQPTQPERRVQWSSAR